MDTTQLIVGGVSALSIGFSKCGLPGTGILVVPLMAWAFPAKESVGVLTPMLIVGDLFAVAFYRRHAQWNKLWNLFPAVVAGMAVAAWLLGRVDNEQMKPILGWLVLALLALDLIRQKLGWEHVPHHPAFVGVMGFLGGFATTMGNVAGPVMTIYFLARGLDKNAFIGTFAWFFLIVNVAKVPLYFYLGMTTFGSLQFNLWMVPLVAVGAFTGRWLLPRVSQELFTALILLTAAIAAARLIIP